MDMLQLLQQKLSEEGIFERKLPKIFLDLSKTIANARVPDKMKLTIAVSELILFASQFRRSIKHWNGSLIPINAITFCLSSSGAGKDSSINTLRKIFKSSYDLINVKRANIAKERAIQKAKDDGKAKSHEYSVYSKYLIEPLPLFAAPSTPEGYVQYLNEIDSAGISAGTLYTGELGSDMLSSPVLIPMLQLIAELYDEGKKELKILKDRDKQNKEIKNLPVSALCMGSPDQVLYEDTVKRRFELEFTTKLARRSFFNYNPESNLTPDYKSLDELLSAQYKLEDTAKDLIDIYDSLFEELTKYQLELVGKPIQVSDEVRTLFTYYKQYNELLAETLPHSQKLSKLARMHMQWKAFKLAGAIAILHKHETIELEDYKSAIRFTELLASDLQEFESELTKQPHEIFAKLAHQKLEGTKSFTTVHELKKLGYITSNSNLTQKLKELCTYAGSYDTSGIYTHNEKGIKFELIVKTDECGISYLSVSGTKDYRASHSARGFQHTYVSFARLGKMLEQDFSYSPFKFKDGVRSKENIEGGTKWIALDIDKAIYTDEEMHEILADFNHHIVRTSDSTNAYKYRILLELDAIVDLDDMVFREFIRSICNYLDLTADLVPKSQIFFSYAGRKILSVTDKNTLETRQHIINATSETTEQIIPALPSNLNDEQKQTLINDPLGTFYYAYTAKNGEGSICLIKAAKHARDLGMTKEQIIELMHDINNYWVVPLDPTRFQNTIINQIEKWSI